MQCKYRGADTDKIVTVKPNVSIHCHCSGSCKRYPISTISWRNERKMLSTEKLLLLLRYAIWIIVSLDCNCKDVF